MKKIIWKHHVKKLIVAVLMILSFCSGFFGHMLLFARAEENRPVNRYYTSVQVKYGETLWDIAGRYCEGTSYSREDYIRILMRMNGLRSDEVHTGGYITVMYEKP